MLFAKFYSDAVKSFMSRKAGWTIHCKHLSENPCLVAQSDKKLLCLLNCFKCSVHVNADRLASDQNAQMPLLIGTYNGNIFTN